MSTPTTSYPAIANIREVHPGPHPKSSNRPGGSGSNFIICPISIRYQPRRVSLNGFPVSIRSAFSRLIFKAVARLAT